MADKKEKDQKFIDEVNELEQQAGGALAGQTPKTPKKPKSGSKKKG